MEEIIKIENELKRLNSEKSNLIKELESKARNYESRVELIINYCWNSFSFTLIDPKNQIVIDNNYMSKDSFIVRFAVINYQVEFNFYTTYLSNWKTGITAGEQLETFEEFCKVFKYFEENSDNFKEIMNNYFELNSNIYDLEEQIKYLK